MARFNTNYKNRLAAENAKASKAAQYAKQLKVWTEEENKKEAAMIKGVLAEAKRYNKGVTAVHKYLTDLSVQEAKQAKEFFSKGVGEIGRIAVQAKRESEAYDDTESESEEIDPPEKKQAASFGFKGDYTENVDPKDAEELLLSPNSSNSDVGLQSLVNQQEAIVQQRVNDSTALEQAGLTEQASLVKDLNKENETQQYQFATANEEAKNVSNILRTKVATDDRWIKHPTLGEFQINGSNKTKAQSVEALRFLYSEWLRDARDRYGYSKPVAYSTLYKPSVKAYDTLVNNRIKVFEEEARLKTRADLKVKLANSINGIPGAPSFELLIPALHTQATGTFTSGAKSKGTQALEWLEETIEDILLVSVKDKKLDSVTSKVIEGFAKTPISGPNGEMTTYAQLHPERFGETALTVMKYEISNQFISLETKAHTNTVIEALRERKAENRQRIAEGQAPYSATEDRIFIKKLREDNFRADKAVIDTYLREGELREPGLSDTYSILETKRKANNNYLVKEDTKHLNPVHVKSYQEITGVEILHDYPWAHDEDGKNAQERLILGTLQKQAGLEYVPIDKSDPNTLEAYRTGVWLAHENAKRIAADAKEAGRVITYTDALSQGVREVITDIQAGVESDKGMWKLSDVNGKRGYVYFQENIPDFTNKPFARWNTLQAGIANGKRINQIPVYTDPQVINGLTIDSPEIGRLARIAKVSPLEFINSQRAQQQPPLPNLEPSAEQVAVEEGISNAPSSNVVRHTSSLGGTSAKAVTRVGNEMGVNQVSLNSAFFNSNPADPGYPIRPDLIRSVSKKVLGIRYSPKGFNNLPASEQKKVWNAIITSAWDQTKDEKDVYKRISQISALIHGGSIDKTEDPKIKELTKQLLYQLRIQGAIK